MKIKNLKLRLAALAVTAGTFITMSGCGSTNKKAEVESCLLKDTILEGTFVGEVDGNLTILRCNNSKKDGYWNDAVGMHNHYFDIVNGEKLTACDYCKNKDVRVCSEINKIGNIESYLTEEELLKASKNELTNEDVVAIVYRINEHSQKEKETQLTLIK